MNPPTLRDYFAEKQGMKYKILREYASNRNTLDDAEFDTVEDAVKHAVAQNYGSIFRIVSIHWEPKYQKQDTDL